MTKLGYFTDTHVRAENPSGRLDNYKDSILTKLEEIGSIFKDAKEIRRFHPINFDEAKGYRYGKLNSLSILRIGLGQQIVKHDKADKKSIYLRTIKSFGLSLGLAKPVYLKIIDSISDNMIYISDKRYDPYNHGVDNIYGRSSLLKGFSKISPYPGVFFKYALNIDYGDRQQEVKTIEAGVVLDFYFKELDIMAFNDNKNYLLNFYLKFGIGNRWNKK